MSKFLSWDEIEEKALKFSKKWEGREGKEKQQAQMFVRDFLACFGVDDPLEDGGEFEHKCPKEVGDDGYIDYFAPNKILIEMKTIGKDLDKAYIQLKDYALNLENEIIPQLLVVSDFARIILRNRKTKQKIDFPLKDLKKHVRKFADIAGYETTRERDNQIEVNVKASEKMAKLHDALKEHGYEGHDLEVYLVRLLFCLFADDTGIFPKDQFLNYIYNSKEDGSDLDYRISKLFDILDLDDESRAKRTMLEDSMKRFRYINGGLFAGSLKSAEFDSKMRKAIIDCCEFDWSNISPAIFGAMFQGVMDKAKRREMGAHYTSEENILKLIGPLFMDELWEEFEKIKSDLSQLERFQNKLATLKFLDPACGCGNFLIIAYRELRRLELEVMKMRFSGGQLSLTGVMELIKVDVDQFYGIEYEDFPCEIAKVGMWLMDHQMNKEVEEHFGMICLRLPLTHAATIACANALTCDWEDVVPKDELSFIMGNPPFLGYKLQKASQKDDMRLVFPSAKNLDYVTAWYIKAAKVMRDTFIKTAFVSTNSISQGEQPEVLWNELWRIGDFEIDFAYRTFKWSNEASGKAAVHCVIVGFSAKKAATNRDELGTEVSTRQSVCFDPPSPTAPRAAEELTSRKKYIFDGDNKSIASNINPYLVNAPNILISKRSKPLCEVEKMIYGSEPREGGFLILSEEERKELISQNTELKSLILQFVSAEDFINNKRRYCLWLKNASPSLYRSNDIIINRLKEVATFRENSKQKQAHKASKTPFLFASERQPETDYLLISIVSSAARKYIPIGYVSKEIITSNACFTISNASLYAFGIINSNVHMSWVRAVCGRLKSDYRYSNTLVYNNFPWPEPTDAQKKKIEETAQGILEARELYPDSSLADLYDPLTMPPELSKAHKANDKAVCEAYGPVWKTWKSEAD
ncbi:MAG: class I SAM-dependent DNA methyltransferase, partial [Anaerovoracaceae bacterium]